ncbi:hypothetical protein ACJ41O_009659 [Fusarium nematophilum]
MSPTLVSRLSSPAFKAARGNFSTAAALLRPMAPEGTPAAVGVAKWRWSNLSPQSRRYIITGLTLSACVDTYVLYNYWPRISGSE